MDEPNRIPALEMKNGTDADLEIMIEPNPDRYLLAPGQRMMIDADLGGHPITLVAYNGGVTVYPGNDYEPPVTIEGVSAHPYWNDLQALTDAASSRKGRGFTAAFWRLFRFRENTSEE